MTNEEKMLDILASMSLRLDGMSTRLDSVDTRLDGLETTTLKTNINIETELIPRLDSLGEGFAGIVETHVPREELDELKERVELLEMAQ